MRVVRLLCLLIVLISFGCSSASKKAAPYKEPIPEDCGDFDKAIRTCSREINHKKLFSRLKKIARCETGNKCTGFIDSPNGLYHGAFQYSRETWDTQCPPIFAKLGIDRCNSSNAIYDVCCATMCATVMISKGGIGNWPTCGR